MLRRYRAHRPELDIETYTFSAGSAESLDMQPNIMQTDAKPVHHATIVMNALPRNP
jgi:hypothetical protein